jgi:hypothetical protein
MYKNARVTWAQEEGMNMGGFYFMYLHLTQVRTCQAVTHRVATDRAHADTWRQSRATVRRARALSCAGDGQLESARQGARGAAQRRVHHLKIDVIMQFVVVRKCCVCVYINVTPITLCVPP